MLRERKNDARVTLAQLVGNDPDTKETLVAPRRYYTLWRNKWLTAHAETIDDMIEALEKAAQVLREMQEAGIALEGDCSDDYAFLYTDDPEIAARFGLQPEEDEEGYDDEDDWSDDLLGTGNGHG